jgi:DNA-binding transcriptional ArsR family regulator
MNDQVQLEPLTGSDYARMLELCGCYHLRMAARVITQRFDQALQPLGLRSTQLVLLLAVGAADEPTISQLARGMGMDPSTLNRNLQPLTEQRLIHLRPGTDGRSRLVSLLRRGPLARPARRAARVHQPDPPGVSDRPSR